MSSIFFSSFEREPLIRPSRCYKLTAYKLTVTAYKLTVILNVSDERDEPTPAPRSSSVADEADDPSLCSAESR